MMGGITKLYLVGVPDHGEVRDPRPVLALLVGSGSREWIEPLYIAPDLAPLGRLWAVVARHAGDPLAVLDSCLAFYPEWFNQCSAMVAVREEAHDWEVLDFAPTPPSLPPSWGELRGQARARFRELIIGEASLALWSVDPYSVLDGSGGT